MVEISFTPSFIRAFKKLPRPLQDEAVEKLDLFRDSGNHARLRVHKLKGALAGTLSFSVNYRYRIVFMWETPGTSAVMLAIGDHAVYN